MGIGKKVEMRVESINRLALARNDNDKAMTCDATQFRNRFTVVENMLDHMGADDGIEGAIGKG